jgi:hypothetical protein
LRPALTPILEHSWNAFTTTADAPVLHPPLGLNAP